MTIPLNNICVNNDVVAVMGLISTNYACSIYSWVLYVVIRYSYINECRARFPVPALAYFNMTNISKISDYLLTFISINHKHIIIFCILKAIMFLNYQEYINHCISHILILYFILFFRYTLDEVFRWLLWLWYLWLFLENILTDFILTWLDIDGI